MTVYRYRATISGTAADDQTWECTSEFQSPLLDGIVFDRAMQDTFHQLMRGKAKFAKPGSCGGPYVITRITIERIDRKN